MTCGTVWSLPPAVISSGPRVLFRVSTLAGEFGVTAAKAASNRVLPGDGIAQRSYSSSESCSGNPLPKPQRHCSRVSATARFRLAGLRSATEATFSDDGGRTSTPLMGAGSIATAAAARSCPSSR